MELLQGSAAQGNNAGPDFAHAMCTLVETPAVPGYEQELVGKITGLIKAISPKSYASRTDNQGNVTITIGSGAPHRLIAAPLDEPGFVVSGITPEGYLTLQRLPQGGNLPLFNELYAAEPVKIGTPDHKWINGAVAGISIHLLPQRQHPPSMADLDNMYVDVGATSAAQARAGGADVLSPVAIDRKFYIAGGEWAAPAIGDRFGAAALLEVLRNLDASKLKGTLTLAFVTQQWLGARGLQRLVYQLKPDELIYVGRLMRVPALPPGPPAVREAAPAFNHRPGEGVLIAEEKPDAALSGLGADLKQLAGQNRIAFNTDFSAPLLPRGGYMRQPDLPGRTVHLAVATAWPSTPAEMLNPHDVDSVAQLLELYLQGERRQSSIPYFLDREPSIENKPATAPSAESILKQLVETYGVSGGHEANVRVAVNKLLPAWARPVTDDAGNLILRWPGSSSNKAPRITVVAHMDEIGYEVHSILPDGRLELSGEGGGVPAYFLGHAALVHSGSHMFPGVLELPEGWDKAGFQWPRGPRMTVHMDIGAGSAEQAAKWGIKAGDFITIPKQYRKLMGLRASARAFDDRVGCAALLAATWALGPALAGRDVTFIWSTSEELGLLGAAAAAKKFDAEGRTPDYVFAVDTFVSSDSPLEVARFGDALLGHGFVVRAVDNSNIVPRSLAEKIVSMSRAGKIPVQYGVTGGGNDGAAFLLYGATDVALGWPLRYSHSPGEVIDVRDLDALAKIVATVARSW
ncbi:MAG TPA: M20/M25/M40 family metallo-hydrolase [Candidatus Limnocylindrales bacterium]|nr:M20/M25/M40 family metallo-hydrolase [Candidatus Limnocylindrales bacterium]